MLTRHYGCILIQNLFSVACSMVLVSINSHPQKSVRLIKGKDDWTGLGVLHSISPDRVLLRLCTTSTSPSSASAHCCEECRNDSTCSVLHVQACYPRASLSRWALSHCSVKQQRAPLMIARLVLSACGADFICRCYLTPTATPALTHRIGEETSNVRCDRRE